MIAATALPVVIWIHQGKCVYGDAFPGCPHRSNSVSCPVYPVCISAHPHHSGSVQIDQGRSGSGGDSGGPQLPVGTASGKPGPLQNDPGICGGAPQRQPAGGQQMGEWRFGPLHLQSDRTGKAVRFVSGGASGGVINAGGMYGLRFCQILACFARLSVRAVSILTTIRAYLSFSLF